MKFIALLFAATLIAGCQVAPTGEVPGTGSIIAPAFDSGGAGAFGQSAAADIAAAVPHTDAQGKAALALAQQALTDLQAKLSKLNADYAAELTAAGTAAKAAGDKIAALNLTVAAQTAQLAKEHAQWVGDRTKLAVKWIVGIAVGVWVAVGVAGILLGLFAGASGLTWATTIFHLLPFANPFAWLLKFFQSGTSAPGPSVSVTVNTVPPTTGTVQTK